MNRADRIDTAVASAGELIGHLQQYGAVTPLQVRLIIEATVRAAVPNFENWEIVASAKRIAMDLEKPVGKEGVQIELPLEGGSNVSNSAR